MPPIKSKRRSRRRRWLKRAAIGILLLATAAGAVLLGEKLLPKYKLWKQGRALDQARAYMKQSDQGNAKLALDVAMLAAPANPEAWRVAAQFLENAGTMQAIKFRRQIVELSPDTLDDRINLITTAIRFNDLATAREALSGMSVEQSLKPEALRVALAFAVATGDAPISDVLYDKLKALYPDDRELRFNHAALRCLIPNSEKAAQARAEMEAFLTDPAFRLRALRTLLTDAQRRKDDAMTRQWSSQLAADPGAGMADLLQRASLETLLDRKTLDDVLPALQVRGAGNPADGALLVRWLVNRQRDDLASAWIAALPADIAAKPELAEVSAELALVQKKWGQLGLLLEKGAWGEVAPQTVQLALAARLLSERARLDLRKRIWEEAIASAGASPSSLYILVRLSGDWQWDQESELTLWAFSKGFPDQTWAPLALYRSYRLKKNAVGMRDVASTLRQQDGSSARYQYDWALLSILTDPTPQWGSYKEVMKSLYESAPQNPFYITGYAFALAHSKRPAEALKVASTLSEVDSQVPARAPFLAYVYGVNKMTAETNRFIEKAAPLDLLTEERALLGLATTALTAPAEVVKPPREPRKPKEQDSADPAPSPKP